MSELEAVRQLDEMRNRIRRRAEVDEATISEVYNARFAHRVGRLARSFRGADAAERTHLAPAASIGWRGVAIRLWSMATGRRAA